MWLFAMFDLPVETPENRRDYTRFRKTLLRAGFMLLQYSVYARYIPSEEAAKVHRDAVRRAVPPKGQVRIIAVTDHQFGKMEVFLGKKEEPPEDPPRQYMLF
ncbi:MAG: CRISPR-associated endonuclease Cas2 [Acidobacteria bacterium]|nr:CRISPR-associated endonuclease Cas2 [Acidobacteriota bacterium]